MSLKEGFTRPRNVTLAKVRRRHSAWCRAPRRRSLFRRIVFSPGKIDRYRSIPWVTYVHPNVKKLKRPRSSLHEGKLDEARTILVTALITARNSPVTRQLRDLLGNVNTEIFFSKEPSPRKTEYTVKRGDAIRRLRENWSPVPKPSYASTTSIPR